VHHKRKIALFVDETGHAIDYEAANDLANLITLCDNCHKAADGHKPLQGFVALK
jgi:5-methylcytosine-specific restriction endonuclease McrA